MFILSFKVKSSFCPSFGKIGVSSVSFFEDSLHKKSDFIKRLSQLCMSVFNISTKLFVSSHINEFDKVKIKKR